MRRVDLTNQTFGDLTVIRYLGDKKWECKCSCGKVIPVLTKSLLHDGRTSCGHKTLDKQLSDLKYNLLGQKFGEWEVKEYLGNQMWLCQCSCGTLRSISSQHLRYGQTTSCGHNTTGFKDLTGKIFGEWEVQEYLGNRVWLCKCSCGTTRQVRSTDLISGKSKSCGHKTTKFKDLTGKTFGEWEVMYYCGAGMYWCKCSCGVEQYVSARSLRSGLSKSCGHGHPLDLTGQTFWDWTALKYVGNHNWLCRCSCGTLRAIPSLRLRSGATKSCGCKKPDNYRETVQSKFGIINISQLHLTPVQIAMTSSKEAFQEAIKSNFKHNPTPKELSKILGITPSQVMRTVRKYDLENMVILDKPVTTYENEINELFPCSNVSDRTVLSGQELDLYYPEQKVAIELNGTYWHSTLFKDKAYHQNKTILAGKQGIHLIHIFEYEWNNPDKRKKLIDLVDRYLNPNRMNVVGARECDIQLVNLTEAQEFLNNYHLQNFIPAAIYIGCYYHGELLGIMTFGTPRFNKDYEYEMLRLCWKSGVIVTGGSQRLLSYFTNNYKPSNIITYCDISKFNGNSYTKLGFKLDSLTAPNYVWVDTIDNQVLSRYKTQKSVLVDKGLGDYSETEDEIMDRLGYLKIYDAGNFKFIWENK